MQDYAGLYPRKHKKMDTDEQIRRIKKLIRKDIPPLIMLACIIMTVRTR